MTTWQDRERDRFDTGFYTPVPWPDLTPIEDHFLHLAIGSPGMVSFTENAVKGEADRQLVIKPGKYLSRYYPGLAPPEVARLSALITGATKPQELFLARTRDDIRYVYSNGPDSCMAGKFNEQEIHPAEVYAGPDTAVAYIKGGGGKITGRSVVVTIPGREGYIRTYGDEARLYERLAAEGFGNKTSLEGVRLLHIDDDCDSNYIVMPYLDSVGEAEFSRCGKYVIPTDGGIIRCQRTDGLGAVRCSHECCNCGHSWYEDDEEGCSDEDGETYCASCYDEFFVYCPMSHQSVRRDECFEALNQYGENELFHNDHRDDFVECELSGYLVHEDRAIEIDGYYYSVGALEDSDDFKKCHVTKNWCHVADMYQIGDYFFSEEGLPDANTAWNMTAVTVMREIPRDQVIRNFDNSETALDYLKQNRVNTFEYLADSLDNGGFTLTFRVPHEGVIARHKSLVDAVRHITPLEFGHEVIHFTPRNEYFVVRREHNAQP
jgi:hypothetical protein